MSSLRSRALLCMLLLLGASLADAAVDREAEIKVRISADIRGTDPGVDRDAITDDVMGHIVEGLVAYREDMTVGPLLAQSITVGDRGRVYRFALRQGLHFHNGAPLTSAEVKWSWDRMLDSKSGWRCRSWYAGDDGLKILSVTAPDPATVVFTLQEPSGLFLPRMASFQCLAAILHPDSLDSRGAWRSPVGTGPYRLQEWKRGQYVLLQRFDGYQARQEPRDGLTGRKTAYAARLRWIIIPDNAAAKAALYAGQLDLLYLLEPGEIAELRRASNINLYSTDSLGWSGLLLQTRDPLLADVRLRQAIAHAVNLPQLVLVASRATASANPSVIPRISPYHSGAQAQGYQFDPALAKRLLAEAKYGGAPIKLQTNRRYPDMFDTAVIAQAMLKKAGLNVQLEVLEWTTQLNNYLEGKFQMMSMGFSGRTDPVLGYEVILGSKQTDPAVQWESPQASELLRAAGSMESVQERQELFDKVHLLMLQDVPLLCLYNGSAIDATAHRLNGYRPWPASKPRLWGVWINK